VLLEDQDRGLWNRALIAEGVALTTKALKTRFFGPYSLQAAIAAVHAEAPSAAATDWSEIIGLYDVLARLDPSPVVALNRAVAIAMRDGPQAGLILVESLLPALSTYHLAHAVHADLCRRAGMKQEAIASYRKALSLARQEPERRFLERRLNELRG
jgi:RNA polymerase sigma-70 factor (ECF subfamily)